MLTRIYDLLKSTKLGIVVGFATAGLLMIGSLQMNFYPAPYAGLAGEDIRFFFDKPSLAHWWFYLLFLCLGIYGINAFLCTLDSVLVRLRARATNLTLYGGSICHLAFLVTLLAHLVGGLYSSQEKSLTIGESPTSLSAVAPSLKDVELRLAGLETTQYPNGMPKEVRAVIKIKKGDKETEQVLGYNHPVTLDHGKEEFLLKDYGEVPQGVVLRVAERSHHLALKESLNINGANVQAAGLFMHPSLQRPVVRLVANKEGENPRQVYVTLGETSSKVVEGAQVFFEDIKVSQAVAVGLKENPSVPLALGAVLLFCVGVVLVVIRLVKRIAHQF
ncbi:MAG: hypothetical protein AAB048_04185 [Planctomycetota bacterium]